MSFEKAVKKQSKLKLLMTGPSGSGKTLSALLIARGIVGPSGIIAVIDTENRSASLYSGPVKIGTNTIPIDFDVCEIEAPFTVEKYHTALKDAIAEKYDAVVIDSITHEWAGSGGLLEQKETLDARGKGNSYTNWATITKQHDAFKELIQQADVHLIATARSKQDYVLSDKNGKQIPQKVGMAPIQREGTEYEFTLTLDMAMNHSAEVSKDRTGLFDGKVFIPSEETGRELKAWLEGGAPAVIRPPKVEPARTPEASTPKPTPTASTPTKTPPPHVAGKALTAQELETIRIQCMKVQGLPPEIKAAFNERKMGQKAAAAWCESKGWDIAAIRHELALDIEEVPPIPENGSEEDIPF
jgi:hypothetical protein